MSAIHPWDFLLVILICNLVLFAYHLGTFARLLWVAQKMSSQILFSGALFVSASLVLLACIYQINANTAVQIPLKQSGDREFSQEIWLRLAPQVYGGALICYPRVIADLLSKHERTIIDLNYVISINDEVVYEGSQRKSFFPDPTEALHFPLFHHIIVSSNRDLVHIIVDAKISQGEATLPPLQFVIQAVDEIRTKQQGYSITKTSLAPSNFEGDWGDVTYGREEATSQENSRSEEEQ